MTEERFEELRRWWAWVGATEPERARAREVGWDIPDTAFASHEEEAEFKSELQRRHNKIRGARKAVLTKRLRYRVWPGRGSLKAGRSRRR